MTLLMRKLKVKRKCNNEQNCLDTEQQYNKSKFLKIKTKKYFRTTSEMEETIRAKQKRRIVLSIAKYHARMFNVTTIVRNFAIETNFLM